jgi:hypothetical protein
MQFIELLMAEPRRHAQTIDVERSAIESDVTPALVKVHLVIFSNENGPTIGDSI